MLSVALLLASVAPEKALDPAIARDGQGWKTEVDSESCIISQEYAGEAARFVAFASSFDVPDELSVAMYVHNSDWSLISGQARQDISFKFDGSGGTGAVKTGNGGLSIIFDLKDYLELSRHAPRTLRIFKEGRLIESLSLVGIRQSDTEFQDCLTAQKAHLDAEARERELKKLPRDPFGK